MTELEPFDRSEAWNLTDSIRKDLETAYDAIERAKVAIPIAKERLAWKAMGYDSFEEYIEEEFGEVFQSLKIKIDDRLELVNVLADSGMSNRQIAGTIGVNEKTIRNDLRRLELSSADMSASNELDTNVSAGQDVGSIGQIDNDRTESQRVASPTPEVAESKGLSGNILTSNEGQLYIQDAPDPSLLIVNVPSYVPRPQIIEATPSEDTPEYFTPRPVAPSWSPPQVKPLPSPQPASYDDPTPDFLAPPAKLEKVRDHHKDDSKHCRTCACDLLP